MELIKRCCAALKKHRERLAWAAAEGLIGAGVGLLMAMLYLKAR